MSSRPSTSNSNNEPPIARGGLRRSFTLPCKPSRSQQQQQQQQQPEIGAAQGIETLFVHPTVKIVSFSASSQLRSRPSSRSSVVSYDSERDGPGTLPWTSPTERTMAAGPLEIYRVPGSVSFLHSGNLLHAILPRSQCWLVDGVSKFAMRVLPNTYYRIELPANNQEELDLVEQLKTTLSKVLYYERTSCPFQRGFGEDLPEMPSSSMRRMSRQFVEPAKRWRLDRVWRPEGAAYEDTNYLRPGNIYYSDTDRSEGDESGKEEQSPKPEGEQSPKPKSDEEEQLLRPRSRDDKPPLSGPFLSKNPTAMRSFTAPPQLSLQSSPPSKVRLMAGLFNQQKAQDQTPPRPALSVLAYRLPPTPESMQDEFTGGLYRESIIESSDDSTNEHPFFEEHGEAPRDEPVIVILEPDIEAESARVTTQENEASTPEHQEKGGSSFTAEAQKDRISPELETREPSQKQDTVTEEANGDPKPQNTQEPLAQSSISTPIPFHSGLELHANPGANDLSTTDTHNTTTTTTPNTSSPTPSTLSTFSSSSSSPNLAILTPAEASALLRLRRPQNSQPSSSSPSSSPPTSNPTTTTTTTTATRTTHTSSPSTTPTTTLLLQKTYSLFLGPPAHLVATMLRIAARIAASGALMMSSFPDEGGDSRILDALGAGGAGIDDMRVGVGEGGKGGEDVAEVGKRRGHRRAIPGSWDLSDDDEDWGF